MKEVESFLLRHKWWFFCFLFIYFMVSIYRHLGEIDDFLIVVVLHGFFGRTIYQYFSGKTMFMGTMAVDSKNSSNERLVALLMAFICFVVVIFY